MRRQRPRARIDCSNRLAALKFRRPAAGPYRNRRCMNAPANTEVTTSAARGAGRHATTSSASRSTAGAIGSG